jgi:hypothetical protein
VRLGHHAEVLQLVLQTDAAADALQGLLNLWLQQQQDNADAGFRTALGKMCGDAPSATVLLAALDASLQLQLVPAVVQLLQLLPAAAPGSSCSQLLTSPQLEQCVQLLCSCSSSDAAAQAAWEAVQRLVSECLTSGTDAGEPAVFTADTIAAYAAAAAAAAAASSQQSIQQQLQQMASTAVLLEAVLLLAGRADAAGAALLLEAVLSGCASQQLPAQQVLQCLTADNLQQLLGLLCKHSSSMPAAEQLVQMWMCQGGQQLPQAAAMALLEAYGKHRSNLQPGAAAVLLGAVSKAALPAASADSNGQQQQGAAAVCSASTRLIAQVCACLAYPSGTSDGSAAAAATAWVDELSSPAAAAALFSCWYWQQPGDPGVLLLLYSRSRQGPGAVKPSLCSLLLDLCLAAAGRDADWHTSKWGKVVSV